MLFLPERTGGKLHKAPIPYNCPAALRPPWPSLTDSMGACLPSCAAAAERGAACWQQLLLGHGCGQQPFLPAAFAAKALLWHTWLQLCLGPDLLTSAGEAGWSRELAGAVNRHAICMSATPSGITALSAVDPADLVLLLCT